MGPGNDPASATASVRTSFAVCAFFSLSVLGMALFEMSPPDWWPSLFFLVMIVLVGLPFLGCCSWSMFLLTRVRWGGVKFATPFVVCMLTLALLVWAPLPQIWLQGNFWWHRADRERIVARVEAGELKPNVSHNSNLIALGDGEPSVSRGGNDIVVEQVDQGSYVLFLTYRGFRHYFAGFLHVPAGNDPAKFFEFADKPPTRLVPYDKDWYFVAN